MTLHNSDNFHDVYIIEPVVSCNGFRSKSVKVTSPPVFSQIKNLLPTPFWENHSNAINAWWEAWELAFKNLRPSNPQTGFLSPYIDSAFNDCLFMWDSVFILEFAKYAINAFDFHQTLDNFYCRQHDDGFICREIKEWDGGDRFHRFDPASTGPNILAFAEWRRFLFTGDLNRLGEVFPALLGYHRWMKKYRTWPDGSYWSTGWGCGMDNQPRTKNSEEWIFYHDHQSWVDANLQALISAQILIKIAGKIEYAAEQIDDIAQEESLLLSYIDNYLWDSTEGFYKDRLRDGTLSNVKTVGAFWSLLVDNIPFLNIQRIIDALCNPRYFNRPHKIPSLSADNPYYDKSGGYWQGSVWPPTNYMVLIGLSKLGMSELARSIALNHYDHILTVLDKTGSFWENYAPEEIIPGNRAKRDFVGWSGLGPIAIFLEYIIGLHPDVLTNHLRWDVYLTELHGIVNYPFGKNGLINLECKKRDSLFDEPVVNITANIPVSIHLHWPGGEKFFHLNQE